LKKREGNSTCKKRQGVAKDNGRSRAKKHRAADKKVQGNIASSDWKKKKGYSCKTREEERST